MPAFLRHDNASNLDNATVASATRKDFRDLVADHEGPLLEVEEFVDDDERCSCVSLKGASSSVTCRWPGAMQLLLA